jgi:hypothetical protein
MMMWPVAPHGPVSGPVNEQLYGDAVFAHLRRLYRYGFRLTVAKDGLRLRQFFADGEIYRPEGYSRDSRALLADLQHMAQGESPLRIGQCRVARARLVLKALGFPDLDSTDSFAVQFAWSDSERWIFICSRPEVFRRETASVLAAKFATLFRAKPETNFVAREEGPSL